MEERVKKLAKTIVNYSLKLKQGEKVLVKYEDVACTDLVKEIGLEAIAVGAIPMFELTNEQVGEAMLEHTTKERLLLMKEKLAFEVEHYDAFVTICYNINDYEGKDVPSEVLKQWGEISLALRNKRTNERKWVLLNYPSFLDAHKAKMPISKFRDFAFDVMNVDYEEMAHLMQPLKKRMEEAKEVRIVGPNTDLSFSIEGLPAIPCVGDMNIPDGEVYTAPVKNSVNGTITYNTPCPYQGMVFHNVSLIFENGKIVKATSDEGEKELNQIFDTDEGARYVGEFSFGFNPKILYPMGDILYDEKILGSIHFTPGAAYEDCFNGNRSSVHWDMVLIQREDYGGGEIYFDGELIRKDGKFVLDDLKPLNYEK